MSTPGQLLGDSLRRQLTSQREYADKHGLDLQEDAQLKDIGVSAFRGKNLGPDAALGQFLQAVRDGKVPDGSVLLVESLDRISRQDVDFGSLSIFADLSRAGIDVHTISDGRVYKARSPDIGDMITSIIVLKRSNDESAIKSYRETKRWKERREKAHEQPMTGARPGWLSYDKNKKRYEIIEDRADVVRSIFDDAISGLGVYAITQRLNRAGTPLFSGKKKSWYIAYVIKLLRSHAVLGELTPHKKVAGKRVPDGDPLPTYYPRIIPDDVFYQAQTAINSRRNNGDGRNNGAGRKGEGFTNPFSGLLRCAYCDAKMVITNKGRGPKGGRYLVCTAAKNRLGCDSTGWKFNDFETSMFTLVTEIDIESIVREDGSKRSILDGEIAALKGKLAEVIKRRENWSEALEKATSSVDFITGKLNEVEQERQGIEKTIHEKEQELLALEKNRGAEDVGPLLKRLRAGDDEAYRLRATIASRLRSLINGITLAPRGRAPLVQKAVETGKRKKNKAVTAALLRDMRRFFAVEFRDGSARVVFPDPKNPSKYWWQELSREVVLKGRIKGVDSGRLLAAFSLKQQPLEG
jgi:DNA invertase Pin-like site-specific DNA recombinase